MSLSCCWGDEAGDWQLSSPTVRSLAPPPGLTASQSPDSSCSGLFVCVTSDTWNLPLIYTSVCLHCLPPSVYIRVIDGNQSDLSSCGHVTSREETDAAAPRGNKNKVGLMLVAFRCFFMCFSGWGKSDVTSDVTGPTAPPCTEQLNNLLAVVILWHNRLAKRLLWRFLTDWFWTRQT